MVEQIVSSHLDFPMISKLSDCNRVKQRGRTKLPECTKKLIFLSGRVLDMIKEKRITTGNQIAKSIINDMIGKKSGFYEIEFKNVQRRVYDALNVLHAMNFITKERNEIRYIG
jgi:hypothetical protein